MTKDDLKTMNVEPGTPVVYRVAPDPNPKGGIFRQVTPSGKFVVVDFNTIYELDRFHVLEVLPKTKQDETSAQDLKALGEVTELDANGKVVALPAEVAPGAPNGDGSRATQ